MGKLCEWPHNAELPKISCVNAFLPTGPWRWNCGSSDGLFSHPPPHHQLFDTDNHCGQCVCVCEGGTALKTMGPVLTKCFCFRPSWLCLFCFFNYQKFTTKTLSTVSPPPLDGGLSLLITLTTNLPHMITQ